MFITAKIAFIFTSLSALQIYDFHIFTVVYSPLHGFIWNQDNNQLLIGLLAQLVECRIGIAEIMGSNPVQAWVFSRPCFHCCSDSVHYCEDRFHIQDKDEDVYPVYLSQLRMYFINLEKFYYEKWIAVHLKITMLVFFCSFVTSSMPLILNGYDFVYASLSISERKKYFFCNRVICWTSVYYHLQPSFFQARIT